MEFDEQSAIKYIRTRLPEEWRDRYDDDQILNVIDIIWDFYEDNGMLDISTALDDGGDDDPGIDEIVAHATKLLRKDNGNEILSEHVAPIVEAELEYEESINIDE